MYLQKWTSLLLPALVLSAAFTPAASAEDVRIVGSIKHTLKQYTDEVMIDKSKSEKEIQLLEVQLSDAAKRVLEQRARDALAHVNGFSQQDHYGSSLPVKIKLGMNRVPVLDQGIHGTCTTFAVTGAIDAIIGKGDYISQLCQLQLGSYLEKEGISPSGWSGAYPLHIINQMERYGAANKKKQHSIGCGGMRYYPSSALRKKGSFMEIAKFQEISQPVFGKVLSWTEIPASFNFNVDPAQTLADVKEAVNSGDRVIFATLLPRTDMGAAGAVGKYKTWIAKDTWVLTPAIVADAPRTQSAHELIITGYDDRAVATDYKGIKHKGLLILRNSWGWWAGNYGEFYMSYDYFKLLAYDVKRFSPYRAAEK